MNINIRKLHIERKDDTGISATKDYPSPANLFITRKPETNYNGEPQPLKFSQPNPISLYREYIYTISALRQFSKTKPKNYFQSQSNTNISESETIATIYKYEQTLWKKWVCSTWITA